MPDYSAAQLSQALQNADAAGDKAAATAIAQRLQGMKTATAKPDRGVGSLSRNRAKEGPQLPSLPFLDRTILTAIDDPEAKQNFLEKKYGKEAVSKDKNGFVVTVGGKKMRADESLGTHIAADAPETTFGIVGAVEGATLGTAAGGPVGGFAGGVAGAAAGAGTGRLVKEGVKAVTNVEGKDPKALAASVGEAAKSGAEGEVIGRGVGAAVGKMTRGPLPGFVTGATQETRQMTERVVAGGARPPAISTMPDARKIQRVAILADKLSGPSQTIDRANMGYLHERASGILDRAGVAGASKNDAMSRLEQQTSRLSSQETGKLIQSTARMMVAPGQTTKQSAYLRQLIGTSKTPEAAYRQLVQPGETDRLERFVKVMGNNSAVVGAVQQQALRELMAGVMDRATSFGVGGSTSEMTNSLARELSQFTPKQQRMLFPNGLDQDLHTLAREMKFLYPGVKDPAMAGLTAGAIMQHAWYQRWYAQATYAIGRAFLQNPSVIRRLAVGFRGTSPQRTAAQTALREMAYFGALEVNHPNQDPEQAAPQK